MINVKPVYEGAAQGDGVRILVDRLWPRGLCPVKEKVDMWLKDAAPSERLKRWFRQHPQKWQEFNEKYRQELEEKAACLELIRESEKKGPVTLLYLAHDKEHNHAVALRELVESGAVRV